MTLSCAKIQHHKDDTYFIQKVEPGLNIPEYVASTSVVVVISVLNYPK